MLMAKMFKTLEEQSEAIRNGSADPKLANAQCNTAGKMISIIRVNLETAKRLGITLDWKSLGGQQKRIK